MRCKKIYIAFEKVPVRYLRILSCFFFQAEDGIRDFHVTGVQTCALPICDDLGLPPGQMGKDVALGAGMRRVIADHEQIERRILGETAGAHSIVNRDPERARSEERRVGKECRSRRSAEALKKNTSITGHSR